MQEILPFLMFQGNAEEAMNHYTSLIEGSEITEVTHSEDGKVLRAIFSLKGQKFMCIDSSIQHDFTFTPSFSIFVICDSKEEVTNLYEQLSTDGEVLMPLGEYPFGTFAWITDRFGISWQFNDQK